MLNHFFLVVAIEKHGTVPPCFHSQLNNLFGFLFFFQMLGFVLLGFLLDLILAGLYDRA
jgi:hypothetical protein